MQFPDQTYVSYSGSTGYKINSRYSLKALVFQDEKQLKSTGSVIPMVRYKYYTLSNIRPPQSDLGAVSPVSNGPTQRAENIELTTGVGYYYTWVHKECWYLSGGLTPGVGYVFTRLHTPNQSVRRHRNNAFRAEARTAFGYNGSRFFGGGEMRFSKLWIKYGENQAQTENRQLIYQFFVGYRLHAPGFLKKVKWLL